VELAAVQVAELAERAAEQGALEALEGGGALTVVRHSLRDSGANCTPTHPG